MSLLPSSKSKIERDLAKQVLLIYGPPKIGKSTLCSKFEKPLFLATESGLNNLSVYKINILTWEGFLETCRALADEPHDFKTAIIDTADNLEVLCADYIVRMANLKSDERNKDQTITHVSDIGSMGKGWSLETAELKRALTKLQKALETKGCGLILVSHANQEECESPTKKWKRWTISVAGKGNRAAIIDMTDIILFVDSINVGGEEKRIIKTKPSMYWVAGDRSNLLPPTLELNYDELAGYFKKGE